MPLLGNGMGFSRTIIEHYGWNATSITEDREYWATLHNNGVRVVFVDETSVYGQIPESFGNFAVPRARWDLGEFNVVKENIFLFLIILFKRRDITSLLAFFELITPPFTIFVVLSCLFFISVLLLTNNFVLTVLGLITIVLLALCIALGYVKSNRNLGIYKKIFLYLPFFIVWRLWNTIRGAISSTKKVWIKSPRNTKKNN